MTYPAAALQQAIYDAVKADAPLQAAMGGEPNIFDRPPPRATFPYITMPDKQFLDAGDTCMADRYDATVVLDIWSRSEPPGSVECAKIAGALRDVILDGVTPEEWTVKATECQDIDHFTDPDGLTARARLTFRFLLEPA